MILYVHHDHLTYLLTFLQFQHQPCFRSCHYIYEFINKKKVNNHIMKKVSAFILINIMCYAYNVQSEKWLEEV